MMKIGYLIRSKISEYEDVEDDEDDVWEFRSYLPRYINEYGYDIKEVAYTEIIR